MIRSIFILKVFSSYLRYLRLNISSNCFSLGTFFIKELPTTDFFVTLSEDVLMTCKNDLLNRSLERTVFLLVCTKLFLLFLFLFVDIRAFVGGMSRRFVDSHAVDCKLIEWPTR